MTSVKSIPTAALIGKDLIIQQKAQAARPGFVGIAPYVDAAGPDPGAGRRILDLEVDVQDQVADLLHPDDGRLLRAGLAGQRQLAAVAVEQFRRPVERRLYRR